MIPYFPPEGGTYRLSLGLKVLAEEDWIEIDGGYEDELAQKRRLVDEQRDTVFQALPGSETAQGEFIDFLSAHLTRHHPNRFEAAPGGICNLTTGETVRPDPGAPLLAAARLIQEDMTVLQPSPEGFRLIAGLVCFPTRWNLSSKLGKPLAAIHDPVPGYAEKLERPMDRLFAGLTADRLLWRQNYSLLDDPELFQPGGHFKDSAGTGLTAAKIGGKLWFRVERQTLRRLPDSETVVFTVRIHQALLQDVVNTPRRAADLLAATRALPEPMKRYKSLPGFEAALTEWLEEKAE
ncbi:MAG: heme-dependent oxidative N-demethylase family protein [Minwuia sp.]|uniref:heme-dependent oxidative N-demethylase family protein n=1 Tax=Minwuia sp. TaxID=2493630 RepID=UPI003A84535E